MKFQKRIYEIIEAANPGDKASKIFDILIITLITLNVLAVIFGTVENLYTTYKAYFYAFEVFSVTVFTVEYLLRIWSCTINEAYRQPFLGRIKFALTPMLIIDLMAILPFFLPLILGVDLRFLRALRLFRLVRVFKMTRYISSMALLSTVLKQKKEELIISLSAVLILLILASSSMYYIENAAQPEVFSSIPATMWWAVATLTTVGYGDVYPITGLGRFFAAIIAILGVGMFALPAGILASGFSDAIAAKKKQQKLTCPYCHKHIDIDM